MQTFFSFTSVHIMYQSILRLGMLYYARGKKSYAILASKNDQFLISL